MFEGRYLWRSRSRDEQERWGDAEGIRNSQWCPSPHTSGAIPHQLLKAVCSQNVLGWKRPLKVIYNEQGHLQFLWSCGVEQCTGLCCLGLEVTHSILFHQNLFHLNT